MGKLRFMFRNPDLRRRQTRRAAEESLTATKKAEHRRGASYSQATAKSTAGVQNGAGLRLIAHGSASIRNGHTNTYISGVAVICCHRLEALTHHSTTTRLGIPKPLDNVQ